MKKAFTAILCCSLIIIFWSCASANHVANTITIQSGQLPPEIKTEDFTLIGVLKGRNSYDKYLKKEFEQYSGKYVLALQNEVTTKYKDVNKYRFLLDCDQTNDEYYAPGPGSNSSGYNTSAGYRYWILDRKTNKKYLRKGKSSFFALEIKAYLQAIDQNRLK